MDITLMSTGLEQGELTSAKTKPTTKGLVSGIDLNSCGIGSLKISNNASDIARISKPTPRLITPRYSLNTEKARPPKTPSKAITSETPSTKDPALRKALFLLSILSVPMYAKFTGSKESTQGSRLEINPPKNPNIIKKTKEPLLFSKNSL